MVPKIRRRGAISSPSRKELALTGKKTALALILILAAASAIRFSGLETQSFDNDELFTVDTSGGDSLQSAVLRGAIEDRHPPGYPVFSYYWIKWFGDSEYALRFPSAAAGVTSVFLVFLIGLRLYSSVEAVIAASFMSVLLFPVTHSQTARMYSMLLAFSLAASYCWILIVDRLGRRAKPGSVWIVACVLCSVLTCYMHYFGCFFVGLQALLTVVLCIRDPGAYRWLIWMYVGIGVAFLPWVPHVLTQAVKYADNWHPATLLATWSLFCSFFNDSSVWGIMAVCLYCSLVVHDCRKQQAEQTEDTGFPIHPDLLLALWLAVPFLAALLKSLLGNSILAARYFIVSLPAAYLLLARAIALLPLRKRSLCALVAILLGALVFDLVLLKGYYSRPRDQFREAVRFVVEREHAPDESLVVAGVFSPEYFDYYFKRSASPLRVQVIAIRLFDLPRLETALSAPNLRRVWFLWGGGPPDPGLVNWLQTHLVPLEHKELRNAGVLGLRLPGPAEDAVGQSPEKPKSPGE